MSPSSDIQSFRELLASSKCVITLAGAGLSAASGIPTYRGPGGLWRENDAAALATPQAFKDNPSQVWRFYHDRRKMYLDAKPNPAHLALASLSHPSTHTLVAPSLNNESTHPLLITQNIDSLSLRVLESFPSDVKAAAQQRVLEMHGSIFVTRCTSCNHSQRNYTTCLASALMDPERHDIPITELPRCGGEEWAGTNRYGRCGGLLRPEVTWFGEVPEHMGEIARRLNWCDLLLVVGTSSTVYPAAGFTAAVKARGGKIAIFNLERSNGDKEADFLFLGPCEETLPLALANGTQ